MEISKTWWFIIGFVVGTLFGSLFLTKLKAIDKMPLI